MRSNDEEAPFAILFARASWDSSDEAKAAVKRFYDPIAFAVPARDVLAFGPANSPAAIGELRATIGRVFPGGDHLISPDLFLRSGRGLALFDNSLTAG